MNSVGFRIALVRYAVKQTRMAGCQVVMGKVIIICCILVVLANCFYSLQRSLGLFWSNHKVSVINTILSIVKFDTV